MARDKLTRCNKWMFQQVLCYEYLKKVNDGRFILHRSPIETMDMTESWSYMWMENGEPKEKEIPDDEVGGSDFIKTYYERKPCEFMGIVVGFETVTLTAELYLDFCCEDCCGHYREYYFASKTPREQIKCARVYYGCNKSRLVPMESISIIGGLEA